MKIGRIILCMNFVMTLSACGDKKLASGNGCFIDLVNNSSDQLVAVKSGDDITIGGWVADDLSKTAPNEVAVNFISTTGDIYEFSKGRLSAPRPDVVAALGLPLTSIAGFGLTGKIPKEINPGIYNIQTIGYYPSKVVACRNEKNIEIYLPK